MSCVAPGGGEKKIKVASIWLSFLPSLLIMHSQRDIKCKISEFGHLFSMLAVVVTTPEALRSSNISKFISYLT